MSATSRMRAFFFLSLVYFPKHCIATTLGVIRHSFNQRSKRFAEKTFCGRCFNTFCMRYIRLFAISSQIHIFNLAAHDTFSVRIRQQATYEPLGCVMQRLPTSFSSQVVMTFAAFLHLAKRHALTLRAIIANVACHCVLAGLTCANDF